MKNNLAELRKRKNLSQKDLSRLLRVAQNTISQWELGKRNIDSAMLLKIADIFEVSIDMVLGYTPIEENNKKIQLNEDELSLIKHYRNLSKERKNQLRPYILFLEAEQEKEKKKRKNAG